MKHGKASTDVVMIKLFNEVTVPKGPIVTVMNHIGGRRRNIKVLPYMLIEDNLLSVILST